MNDRSFFNQLCHSPMLRCAAVMLVTLAWSSLAFCGEIHDAAQSGDLEKVKTLLKDNSDLVSSKDTNGLTPLHVAADWGHKDVAELLLAKGADVNAKVKDGETPLDMAAFDGHKDVVELLLASKAKVNIYDAAAYGDLGKVKALLKDNPDLIFRKNTEGETALLLAVQMLHKNVVELLLAKGANVNARDNHGQTPLLVVTDFGNLVWGILGTVASEEESQKVDWKKIKERRKELVELLLTNKADVNAKDNDGETPLHFAAQEYDKDVAELLLAHKAKINAKNKDGETPLLLAASDGHKDVAELLLANKADVNAKDKNGSTPLRVAARQGDKDMVELLLANKADVNARDANGMTPCAS
jgi:ankyrin repeat protein